MKDTLREYGEAGAYLLFWLGVLLAVTLALALATWLLTS